MGGKVGRGVVGSGGSDKRQLVVTGSVGSARTVVEIASAEQKLEIHVGYLLWWGPW